jgi:phosphopantothenoylcysteine decarboxylase/phosphopantothenate--cysteine ligase
MSTKNNRIIIVGISGGIAAYKTLSLIRLLKKEGFDVRVVATQNALQFITPLTIETLSQNKLYCDTFELPEKREVQHIAWAEQADSVVVAPASANIIGKYANGIADDVLSTLLLACRKKVIFAPAMNTDMYEHPAVQKNMTILKERGVEFIEPTTGELACGTVGYGRMEEPEVIFRKLMNILQIRQDFKGKKILITAGPTYEAIDPVRFIGNHSSGLMGYSLTETLLERGAEVCLISGPVKLRLVHPQLHLISVTSAKEMEQAVMQNAEKQDIIIMAAAVADYTPTEFSSSKIKKNEDEITIKLKKTKDILAELSKKKRPEQFLVGFALETDHEIENARKKLSNKNVDMLILNSLKSGVSGCNTSTNIITILFKNGEIIQGKLKSKKEVAKDITEAIQLKIKKLES